LIQDATDENEITCCFRRSAFDSENGVICYEDMSPFNAHDKIIFHKRFCGVTAKRQLELLQTLFVSTKKRIKKLFVDGPKAVNWTVLSLADDADLIVQPDATMEMVRWADQRESEEKRHDEADKPVGEKELAKTE
jgi:hypothetical protein